MENEDSTKKIANEILEIIEHNSKGYLIGENEYEILKMKCEMLKISEKPPNKNKNSKIKIDFENLSLQEIKNALIDLPRHKSIIIYGITIWWISVLTFYFASEYDFFYSDNIMFISLLSIPAIFGIVYNNPFVGASVGFFSSLPIIFFEPEAVIITILALTSTGMLPIIIISIISIPIINKIPNSKFIFEKYNWIVGFSLGLFINLISDIIFLYFQINFGF